MVININAKIELDRIERNESALVAALTASLPWALEQVTSASNWKTVLAPMEDREGNMVGELIVSLAPP